MRCDQGDARTAVDEYQTVPSLAAHTESALQGILADETAEAAALAEISADAGVDDNEDSDVTDDTSVRTTDTPIINTRLPGVAESLLPSFRRQMYRTDI